MHSELDILRNLFSDKNLPIETPIAHIVPRDPTFVICTAATPHMIAGWSIDLNFFWCYNVSPGITRRVIDKSVNRKKRIKLDVLKMAGLVINFAAAIHICWSDKIDIESFPVLLNACDGLSSVRWLNYRCKTSLAGRALGRLLVGLLMTTKLGIQAEWDSKHDPEGSAQLTSHLETSNAHDFMESLNKVPPLLSCRKFQPSHTLLGMICKCIGNNVSPDVRTTRVLEPSALGQIISLDT